ncbi:MAG: YjjG family noncanonical pyrimidine nucleotidase [Raineya sp.]|nr:YjjG family noncanonical pyrimidine nucleotidase [Raineya sp.]
MSSYQHIIFDLDHTLWDFERNSNETLLELHKNYLNEQLIPQNKFLEVFHEVNAYLWHLHDTEQISAQELREKRFTMVFGEFNFHNPDLSLTFSQIYLEKTPRKPHLLPKAKEILDYLCQKYKLHIITNGFPEIQRIKMESAGILQYFQEIVTSAEAGCKKPQKGIFEYLLQKLQSPKEHCLMIGDNLLTDIEGSLQIGLDCVFYNPKKIKHDKKPSYEISCLSELKEFL